MTRPSQALVLAAFLVGAVAGCAVGTSSPGGDGTGGDGSGGAQSAGVGGAGQMGTGGRVGAGGSGSGGTVTAGTGGAADAGAAGGRAGTGGRVGAGGSGSGGTVAAGTGGATDAGAADRARDASAVDARDGGADADVNAGFAPCPTNGSACIVMPLGDSITEGYPAFNGGYRVELFHQAIQGGKKITFVGRRPNGPATVDGQPFPPGNEGYSGYTIDTDSAGHTGISPLVQGAITMFHPHIILLMIGTNDVNGNVDLANAPTRLGNLIDRITTAAPAALLVVAQIVPTTSDGINTRVQAYNAAIPALVQQRAAAGKHVVRVDMYTTFTSHADYKTALMTDMLHPTTAGYALMGQTWYATISPFLSP
jgi:lysophospholipase L1-like esterase